MNLRNRHKLNCIKSIHFDMLTSIPDETPDFCGETKTTMLKKRYF